MKILRLTRVESSLVGSVRTESLRMSPSSSDRGSSFTIKSSRLMGAFTFLDFVQPGSFCGDFYFSWRAMTIYSASCFGGNLCRLFVQMYAALRMFYGFCVRLCMAFAYVYSFCVHVYSFCARCADCAYVYGLYFSQAATPYVRDRT